MYWNTKYDEWYLVVKNPELMGLRLFVLNIKGRRSASADASIVYAWNSKGWSVLHSEVVLSYGDVDTKYFNPSFQGRITN